MKRECATCGKPLYRYNRSGYCKPCFMRTPEWAAVTRKAVRNRIAAFADKTGEERLAKFRTVNGAGECWGWGGATIEGYGVVTMHGRQRLATHIALELDGRPRPSTEHVACHSCDNPPCTNPAHLWWGTEKDNMQDAAQKGRLSGWSRQRGSKKVAA